MITTFETAIATHADRDAPREACGLVLRVAGGPLVVHETRNMALEPEKFFQIPPEEVLAAKRAGTLVGYYHSHPAGNHEPSPADMANAEQVGLPSFIFGGSTRVVGCYVPRGWRAPLEGREFVPLVHDCIALVWDWMEIERGIKLPYFPRAAKDYQYGTDFDFKALIKSINARLVSVPSKGDVVVMTTGSSTRPNHIGVLLGGGLFLHQTIKGSKVEPFTGHWLKRHVFTVRVPDATPAAEMRQDEAPVREEVPANV